MIEIMADLARVSLFDRFISRCRRSTACLRNTFVISPLRYDQHSVLAVPAVRAALDFELSHLLK